MLSLARYGSTIFVRVGTNEILLHYNNDDIAARVRERKSVLGTDTRGYPAPASSLLFLEMSKSTPMPLHLLTPGLVIIRRPLIASLDSTTK